MNVLFVSSLDDIQSPAKPLQTQQQIQFGISYISSFLKRHGHNTKLVVISKILGRRNKDIINKYLRNFSPKLICFTAVATEYCLIKNIASYIKRNYRNVYLLIGGPHASLNPKEVLLDSFDALCIGEGEYPTLELVEQLEKDILPSGIRNLWIKWGSQIERNPTRPFLQDLDSLPFLDREIWQEWIEEKSASRSSILLGRGCPFQCSYCCNHALKRLAQGDYVRHRSPDNILKEIREIVARFPTVNEIYLEVETISISKDWPLELCSKLELFNKTLGRPLSFGTNVRIIPKADLERLFIAFKSSNFRFINIGLESGSERVRNEILKREYSNQDVVSAVRLARKYGLKISFYNMIGIPGETVTDFKETVRMNRLCLPDWHQTSIFFPYPGTDLYSLCKAKDLIREPLPTEMERRKATLELPCFSKRQIQKSYILFEYYVYRNLKPMHKILARVIRSVLESNFYLNHIYRRLTRLSFFKWLKDALREY